MRQEETNSKRANDFYCQSQLVCLLNRHMTVVREKLCRIRIHNMFPDITIINKHAQIWAGSLADCVSYNLKESSKLKLDVANCSNVETLRGFSCSL